MKMDRDELFMYLGMVFWVVAVVAISILLHLRGMGVIR